MSNLSDLIPAGGGQNNTDFVADGAIASGKPVILTAAGKAAEVDETTRSNTIGAEQSLNGGVNTQGANAWAYDATNDQYLWAYGDMGDSQHGWAHIVDISSGSVVEGTAVEFANWATGKASATCIGSNKFLIVYSADIGTYLYGRVASVSGTTISYGTEVAINSNITTISQEVVKYSATTDASLLMYKNTASFPDPSDDNIYLRRITVSGTTITLGSATTLTSVLNNGEGNSANLGMVYNSASDEFFLAWREDGSSGDSYGGIVTMDGGGTLAGTSATELSDDMKGLGGLVYCGNDTYAVFFQADTGDYAHYCVATVSGGNTTWGTDTAYESSATTVEMWCLGYDSSVDKVIAVQKVQSASYTSYTTGDLSGTTITFAALTDFPVTAVLADMMIMYDPVLEQTVWISKRASAMYLQLWTVTGDVTNLTATNLLGIASGAILDTATGTINTWGSRNEVQSGLTIASDYYAQEDGTITTTSTSPAQLLGKALSATQINIKDYTG